MKKGLLMILLGGTFVLLGIFTMPMRRANPRQNLVDNPIGWGLFGFGLSSLLVGISTSAKEKNKVRDKNSVQINEYHIAKDQQESKQEHQSVH